jgi:hypothetical protein
MVRLASRSLLMLLSLLWAAASFAGTAGSAARIDVARDDNAEAAADPLLDMRAPVEVEDGFLQTAGVQAHFEASNKMSELANMVLAGDRVISVPHFNSSFAFQGKGYRYTVVGGNPKKPQTTAIPTQIIPISLFFEGYADEKGRPIVLEVAPNLSAIANSPNFRAAQYPSGNTQFADAIQRAQFFHVMSQDWHTLLDSPKILRAVNIEVPRGFATLYRMRSTGAIFAVVDEGFFISQLNTIIQFEDMDVSGLPIALTANVFLAPNGDIRQCCVMGFHTSFDAGERDSLQLIQTFIWASWIGPGIFGGTIADVTAMSHEISEWFNDPFNTNIVPEWQFPGAPSTCQNNLETGDPMSASPHAGYPVIIDGFTYHPQNETLLQWFQRKTPSDAVDRAYSFPDENLLTSPAQGCASR